MADFTLPKEHVPLLGTLWPGDRNALSPLIEFGSPEERDGAKKILAGSAVLEPTGEIDVGFHHVMSVLDDPKRFVSLDLMTSGDMKSLETYYSTDNVSAVSLISGESGDVQVREDAGLQAFFASEDLPDIPNNELTPADVTLSLPEAWVAAAVFDAERRSAFAAVMQAAAGNDLILEPAVHDPASILGTFASSGQNPENSFFLNLLDGLGGMYRADMDPAGVEGHLQSLQVKGLLMRSGSGYTMQEPMLPMIRRTLLFNGMAITRTGRKDGTGRIVTESSLCIRADGTLLWFIRPLQAPDEFLLKYVSSGRFGEILQSLFGDGTYSLSGMIVPAAETKPKIRFCPQCGAEHRGEAIFCNQCGYRFT
jgi:hypothetical protein